MRLQTIIPTRLQSNQQDVKHIGPSTPTTFRQRGRHTGSVWTGVPSRQSARGQISHEHLLRATDATGATGADVQHRVLPVICVAAGPCLLASALDHHLGPSTPSGWSPIRLRRLTILNSLCLLRERTLILQNLAQSVQTDEHQTIQNLADARLSECYTSLHSCDIMQRVPKNDAFYDRADFPQGDGDGKENHNLYFISGVNTLNTLNTLGSVKICVRQDLRATTQAFQATALRDVEATVERKRSIISICFSTLFNILSAATRASAPSHSQAPASALPQKPAPFRRSLRSSPEEG